MSLAARRRAVRQAEHRLERECARWQASERALRGVFARHPFAWALGGGFASGVVAGWLPWRACLRVGELATDVMALILRLPTGRLLAVIRNAARAVTDTSA